MTDRIHEDCRFSGHVQVTVTEKAVRAREASRAMLASRDDVRRGALEAIADALEAAATRLQEANLLDLDAARTSGLDEALLGRLELSAGKLATAVDGMRQVAAGPDPVGRTLRQTDLDEELELYQVTAPLGVVACIFESRPDVCIQIPTLSLRTANAVLLKGGREADHTNRAIVEVLRASLAKSGLPEDAVQLLEGRAEVEELLRLEEHVDLIVPRGGNELVRHIQRNTRIPVLGHAAGVCHIYVDRAADLEKAQRIVVDAKLDSPTACNAVETLLVHQDLRAWLDGFMDQLRAAGVALHAGDADFDREYGAAELSVRIVADLDEALLHIARHGSGHTDAIVTEDPAAMRRFVNGVDSAGVFVNASTRFADGYRYGLGAEVGISTGKIHARGPVGMDGLLSTRWILVGSGHRAGDYHKTGFHHIHHTPDPDAMRGRLRSWEELHA